MHWAENWVGLPVAPVGRGPDAYDCLGLFLALQRARLGREIPDPRCTMDEAAACRSADKLRPLASRIARDRVLEGDALLFFVDGRALHVGYALDANDMIHAHRDASKIERWTGRRWINRLEGIYRFA